MNKGGICFVKAYLDANDTFYNFLSLPLANYYIGGLGEVEIELSGKFAGKEHGCVFARVKLLSGEFYTGFIVATCYNSEV